MTDGDTSNEVSYYSYDHVNYTYEDYPLIMLEDENFTLAVINAVCYSLIISVSLPGNGFLLWFLLKKVGLRSSADRLLLHLTVSDLIFTFTLLPWTVNHLKGWIFGDVACKLFSWSIFLGLYSYMTFLTAITIHRYVVVVHPVFASSMGHRGGLYVHVTSALVWLISIGFSLPEMIFSKAVDGPASGIFCVPEYSSYFMELFGYLSQIILFFLLPFLVITFCYARMGFSIRRSHIRRKNHAVGIVLSMAVGFFICWAPYNILLLLVCMRTLGVDHVMLEDTWGIYSFTHVLAYSHCCLNPLVHIFGGKKFRRNLRIGGFRRLSSMLSNQSSFFGQVRIQSQESPTLNTNENM